MPVLRMETEVVRGVGYQLQQASDSLQQQTQQLNHSVQTLTNAWQGPSADLFAGEIQPLLSQLNQFADVGAILNQRLQREVDEWERVSNSFGQSVGANLLDFLSFPVGNTAYLGRTITDDGTNFFNYYSAHGQSETSDLFPHTKYHLFQGQQREYMGRYLAGEMTWDEMLQRLDEMEKSLEPSYFDKNFTLYKFAEGQWETGAAYWRDDWGGEDWHASLRVRSLEATGNYGLKLSEQGLEGSLQSEVGFYAVRGQYNAEVAGVDVALDGYVGAQAEGELKTTVAPGVVMGTLGASAFAGARVDGSISKEVEAAGIKTKGEARGGVSYGVGFKAEADVVLKPSLIKADVDFGATLGLGAELGFSVDLDVTDAVDNVVHAGRDLADFGSKGINEIFKR